jgi:hypothetical protein
MANISIFDPATGNTKTVSLFMKSQIIQQDEDGQLDHFMALTTSAKKISGAAIPEHSIRTLGDLAKGSTQQDGATATDYASITAAVQDHVLNMIEGNGGSDAMDFSS